MYTVNFADKALKELRKMDKHTSTLLYSWISRNLDGCMDPRIYGKGLTANRSGQWRYRVGEYRIIAEIHDSEITILVLEIGHRRNIY